MAFNTPSPIQENILCSYVAFLAEQKLKHRTIKAYLSGIRYLQIQKSLGNPFTSGAMPRLEYVLTGIKRVEAQANTPTRVRLPITLDIMQNLRRAWTGSSEHPEGPMLWAAACVGFFGFLRAGEFTVPSTETYDPEVRLNLVDLALDSHVEPTVARIRIKQSKTDPFRQGVDIFLGRTEAAICPVTTIIHYIGIRKPGPDPLFRVLPFGLCSGPKLFSALTDAMMWFLWDRGVESTLHYLDDFLLLGPPRQPACHQALSTTLALCEELGFPVAPEKTEGPTTSLTFLGIEIDRTWWTLPSIATLSLLWHVSGLNKVKRTLFGRA